MDNVNNTVLLRQQEMSPTVRDESSNLQFQLTDADGLGNYRLDGLEVVMGDVGPVDSHDLVPDSQLQHVG